MTKDFAIKPLNCRAAFWFTSRAAFLHVICRFVWESWDWFIVMRNPGQLHGLMRVRCFTQDDAAIFMTPDQIREEIKGVAKLIDGYTVSSASNIM